MPLLIEKIFLWLMIYSFFGWVYESILCSITSGSLVNRGFLNGPVCPVYGFGALVVILAFWWEPDIRVWNLFFSSMVLTCTLEYLTSWAMEKLFHARWWDYSQYRFNINGRVCLLGAVAFGAFSVLLIKVVHPRVSAFVDGFSPAAITAASAALFLTGAVDCMVTVRHILALNGRLAEIQAAIDAYRAQSRQRAEALGQRLQARLEESVAASGLEELRERLEERFEESVHNSRRVQALLELRSFQDRRLLRAFPHLSSTRYGDALKKLRERIEQHRS
ncbi:MAG: putative ABC transporter permease [Lawsonibacter sp.]|jgi:uncharacterized membrane protein|nr:putative ABC transporter permease [Lawsonibacter sp.]MCI9194294.1 putative ABC transporter permease [Angelakisella sp.]